jgi:hypothetical protein
VKRSCQQSVPTLFLDGLDHHRLRNGYAYLRRATVRTKGHAVLDRLPAFVTGMIHPG